MSAHGATIIKLGLGDTTPDIEFDGTTLATADDGDGTTNGDQNTRVEFTGFLSAMPDILTPGASFSLVGLAPDGPANIPVAGVFIQNFDGGTLELYDDSNALLLSGMLDSSALAGPLGATASGGLFTTSFADVSGGSLAPTLDPDSLTFSMSLTDVNGGSGFGVNANNILAPFVADVTVNIDAQFIPEPAAALLALMGAMGLFALSRKRPLL